MVPLREDHAANGIIEKDRMLLVSGTLSDQTFGSASSALFDGQNFIPYIVTTSASGDPGAVSALIHSFTSYSFNSRRECLHSVFLYAWFAQQGVQISLRLVSLS